MTIQEFFLKWNGIGCDFDGAYGFQCMDIFEQYHKDIVGGQPIYGNAIDVINKYDKGLYDFFANSPSNFPSLGDVILWTNGVGQYGHIAICYMADSNHFISFDQNWPVNSLCHFQSHNYQNVAGWLHPKVLLQSGIIDPTIAMNDQTKLPIGERPDKTLWGDNGSLELQAVRSTLNDQFETIKGLKEQVTTLTSQVTDAIGQPPLPLTNIPGQITPLPKPLNLWERLLSYLGLSSDGKN